MTTQNPYETTHDFDAARFSAGFNLYDLFLYVLFVALASYGLCRLLEDYGVIAWHDGGSHFWFEPELKKWIHER